MRPEVSTKKFKSRRILYFTVVFFLIVLLGLCTEEESSDFFLKIYRSIDIYTRAYKELALNYVDTIDPEALMRSGIEGMLKTLDPYTIYMGEKENEEIDLVTSGKYGGIGVTIGLRDGYITVVNLLEGFSAAKQGIEIGDRIIEVDGKSTKQMSLEKVRQMVRGIPGTEVKLKIEREGVDHPIEFVLIREEIKLNNVTYTGFVSEGIGYIKLERFSRTAGNDFRDAVKELLMQGNLKGLVLDLRDNPGGLLESAVDVASKFLPENSLVVTTRGRRKDSERKYYSTEPPMLKELPVAVLVNRYSASASEIVSGAIQDYDRGVIVGSKTFGKGLVQTITRLSENASLKLTTARYYTPSGRCIQEIDYWHRDSMGIAKTTPDSLKRKFYTVHKRSVWEGGGILPDTVVEDTSRYPFIDELNRKAIIFKYANYYASKHKSIPENFDVDDEILNDFVDFMEKKGFVYEDECKSKLKELRSYAVSARCDKMVLEHIEKIEELLNIDLKQMVTKYRKELCTALRTEIVGRIKGEKARIESGISTDMSIQTAVNILKNEKLYSSLLSAKSK